MEEIYIAVIGQGEYGDYYESEIFASFDKDKVEKWVSKFNKIVEDNRDRICSHYDDGDYNKNDLFWYDYISYSRPIAIITTVEFR